MRRLTHSLTTLAVVCWSLSAAAVPPLAYVRLAYQPESKSGEFRVGHRIVQTTGVNAGSVGRIVAGGDSNTRGGYSLIIDTLDTFDSGARVNDPSTGGQVLVEYVGGVRTVAAIGASDDADIGDGADAQCWANSACGDVCLIIEAGTYDLPHDGTGAAFDERISIYALEGITAKLTNDEVGTATLQTDMTGAVASRGWLEIVGVEIEQGEAAVLWDWTAADDEILFSRVQFAYDNAPLQAFLFSNDADDAVDIHILDSWNTYSAGVTQRIFDVDTWTDYLIQDSNWTVDVELASLKGRGIWRRNLTSAEGSLFGATIDGNTLVANNVFTCPGKPISNSGLVQIESSTTSRRTFAINNSAYAPSAGASPIAVASGVGESVISGNVVHGDGNCITFHAKTNANQRLYNNRAFDVAALTSVAAPGTWVQDDNSILTAAPFVAPAAAPPDFRLNSAAGGGALCKGMVRRLPIVSPDTDITGYPRDRTAMADAGAWQSRDLVRLRLSSLSDDDADFSDRVIVGQTSGAIGLVRDWEDRRIWDTDGAGAVTSRAGHNWGSVIVDVISGTFAGSETVHTIPNDYSDIPVGMWGGPFAPYRTERRADAIDDTVRTVRNKWSGTIQLADYLTLETARAAAGALDVLWIDDSEQYLDDIGTCSAVTVMGAPWHLPEIYAPAAAQSLRANVGDVTFIRLRIVEKSGGTAGLYSMGVAHQIRVDHCEFYGQPGHTRLFRTNHQSGWIHVANSLLLAQDGVGIQAKSTNITIVDTTVDYATQALYVVAGRTAGDVLVDRCKFWETDSATGGLDYRGVDGDVVTVRNVATSARTGGAQAVAIDCTGLTAAGGSAILVEGLSAYSAGAAAGDVGIYVDDHDEAIMTVRGCAFKGPAGLAGTALSHAVGTADVISEYNAWHGYSSGYNGNWSDTGTINSDPLFTDVTAAPIPNLYPSAASPLLGLVDNGQTSLYDIDGRRRYRRGDANDAGAYERFGTYAGDQRNVRLFLGYGVEPQPGQQWFEIGETIWSSGGTTGVVVAVYGDDLIVEKVTLNPWVAGHTVVASSGSTGTIVALGDIHTVSPRRDRDSALAEEGETAAAHGDIVTHRDGWIGEAPGVAVRALFVAEPIDAEIIDAHPIAHARRMDPLRGRYVGMRGAAVFDSSRVARWNMSVAGSTDGWQGWAGLILTGEGPAQQVIAQGTAGKIILRDDLILPRGLPYTGAGSLHSFQALSVSDTVQIAGSWFRAVSGMTVPSSAVGTIVQARLPDTAVTGTVVSRDNVHEDITEHALYQDAAASAYDITVQRCLLRRYWATVVNMTVATAARLNVSLSQIYGGEQPAPLNTPIHVLVIRGTARAEMTTLVIDRAWGKTIRGMYLYATAVASGMLVDRDNYNFAQCLYGAGTATVYDSVVNGITAGIAVVNVLTATDPLWTDDSTIAPDLHLQDGSPALGHVDPANLSLIARDAVDFHGFPVLAWWPHIHAGALQHPVPGRVPRDWGGMHRSDHAGSLWVPNYTR